MTPIGPKSRTDARPDRSHDGRTLRGSAVAAIATAWLVFAPGAAPALDLFTFWNDPEITLDVESGDWALYRMVTLDAGRRSEDLVRFRCESSDDAGWRLVVLPVVEHEEEFVDVSADAWSFTLDRDIDDARRSLADHVHDVVRMEAGVRRAIPDREWREDPLLSVALGDGFDPDVREDAGATTRVVAGRDLLCTGMNLTSRDTTRIDLPRGQLMQLHTREVSVTLHEEVPFLGVVYASERGETRSELDPPGSRRQPPPRQRIETMELIDYGSESPGRRAGG